MTTDRNEMVTLKLTARERTAIERAAKKAALPMSTWIREHALRAAGAEELTQAARYERASGEAAR